MRMDSMVAGVDLRPNAMRLWRALLVGSVIAALALPLAAQERTVHPRQKEVGVEGGAMFGLSSDVTAGTTLPWSVRVGSVSTEHPFGFDLRAAITDNRRSAGVQDVRAAIDLTFQWRVGAPDGFRGAYVFAGPQMVKTAAARTDPLGQPYWGASYGVGARVHIGDGIFLRPELFGTLLRTEAENPALRVPTASFGFRLGVSDLYRRGCDCSR